MEVGEVILFHLFLVPIAAVAMDLFKKIKLMNFSTPKVGCLHSLHNICSLWKSNQTFVLVENVKIVIL